MTTASVPLVRLAIPRSPANGFLARLRSLHTILARWRERARQRRRLALLDDRLLADIGVTRAQALREARKWFWQD